MKIVLSENLKKLMKERRIKSLRELSLMCSIPQSTLHHVVNGRGLRDWTAIARISHCLNVSLYFLLFGKSDPVQEKIDDEVLKEIFNGELQIEMKIKKRIK